MVDLLRDPRVHDMVPCTGSSGGNPFKPTTGSGKSELNNLAAKTRIDLSGENGVLSSGGVVCVESNWRTKL